MNARCFASEILQQIKFGTPVVIDGDQFSICDRSHGQVGQCLQVTIAKRLNSQPEREASFVEPMECLSVSKLPEGSQWLWEMGKRRPD